MSKHVVIPNGGRRRLSPIIIGAGVAAAIVLSLSFSGTLAAFNASIQNTSNTATSASMSMTETSGSASCASVATSTYQCSTINKYGGDQGIKLVPGSSTQTKVTIATPSTSASPKNFTLTPATCTSSLVGGGTSSTSLCDKLNVVITYTGGAQPLYSGTASGLTAAQTVPAAVIPTAGNSLQFTFTVTLDAGADNSYQNLQASQPLTWTYSS